jgi:hypothetical protein
MTQTRKKVWYQYWIAVLWIRWIRIQEGKNGRDFFVRIRILQSTNKKMKKKFDFYCFVTSL